MLSVLPVSDATVSASNNVHPETFALCICVRGYAKSFDAHVSASVCTYMYRYMWMFMKVREFIHMLL